ncbi:MAG TPA: hypothetical protein VK106_00735 [Balneolaceae bacterium]|nr:hypothetical protein [Balneolaceae bacterium]
MKVEYFDLNGQPKISILLDKVNNTATTVLSTKDRDNVHRFYSKEGCNGDEVAQCIDDFIQKAGGVLALSWQQL